MMIKCDGFTFHVWYPEYQVAEIKCNPELKDDVKRVYELVRADGLPNRYQIISVMTHDKFVMVRLPFSTVIDFILAIVFEHGKGH